MLRDLQHAFRTLRRGPLFALAVVMTLALGIGVNATVFVLVDRLLFNPPPVRSIEDLVAVSAINTQDPSIRNPVSYPNFEDLRAASESLSDLVAHTWIEVALSDGERPEQVLGQFVSSNFFDGLGVGAAAGRTFGENPGREVILSHRLWQRRYGGDRGVIGRTVQLNTLPFTVIGIAPRGFHGPSMATAYDLWVATTTSRDILGSEDFVQRRAWGIYELIGRLAPGATLERAAEELTVVGRRRAPPKNKESPQKGGAGRDCTEAPHPETEDTPPILGARRTEKPHTHPPRPPARDLTAPPKLSGMAR
ncbi:MAG: ABC transporter permease, partial [Acidobacteriota bacterium]